MTIFDDREDVFEKVFAKDSERDFKIEARLAKLFGFWAAEQLGLEEDDVQTYAQEVISANLKEPGFEDIFEHVQKDFDEKELTITRAKMEAVLRKCTRQAQKEID